MRAFHSFLLSLVAVGCFSGAMPALADDLTPQERFAVIERKYFGHGYPEDSLEDRIFRMENLVFGSAQTMTPIPERIFKLEAVLNKPETPQTNAALNPGESEQTPPAPPPPVAVTPTRPKATTFNDLMFQAQQDINLTRYHAAADELRDAIQLNAKCPKAYNLLGDTLIKLQDRDGAKEAYRACFQVDPFGAEGRIARSMLLQMTADDTTRATAPQDTPKVVDHTIRTINNQAADLANRYRQDGNRWSNFRRYLGNIQAQKADDEAFGYRGTPGYNTPFRGYGNGFGANGGFGGNNGAITGVPNGYGGSYYGGGGGTGGGPTNIYNPGEISNVNSLKGNYLRTDAIVQANKARYAAAEKAAFVQESAANLKDQMLKPAYLRDDSRLKALGTSLYARYYGDDAPSIDQPPVPVDPVLELKAKAQGLKAK